MKSLATAFKEVYGEALKEYGFKKVKSKYPYYARMVGDEIVHVITYATRPKQRDGFKEYIVLGGVATVYRAKINFDIPVTQNFAWLDTMLSFYKNSNPKMSPNEYKEAFEKWYSFSYCENSESGLLESMSASLADFKKIMLPVLNDVTRLENCYEFYKISMPSILTITPYENYNRASSICEYNEGLLNFVLFNEKQFGENEAFWYEHFLQNTKYIAKRDGLGNIEQMIIDNKRVLSKKIELFNSITNNSNEYDKIIEELQFRKKINLELMRMYNI